MALFYVIIVPSYIAALEVSIRIVLAILFEYFDPYRLGIISQIKPINSNNWKSTQLQMVLDLYRSGSNSIWEHTLLDPHVLSSGNHHQATHNKIHQRKKPQPNDPLHPNKSDFIRAKYQSFAFVNKSHGIKDDVESEADISEQLHSSVRTPNLKTSLRLLVAGANP